MAALRFRSPRPDLLANLTEQDWKDALGFCDRAQLTLQLGLTNRDYLPDWVRLRIEGDLVKCAQRWTRVKRVYGEVSGAFTAAGLECAVMKGFSHCPRFVGDPRHRRQGDVDLLFTESQVRAAYHVALGLGYEPIIADDPHPTNHLPTLIRKTGWIWQGDYFDPEIPILLELHFAVWDEETELFGPSGLEQIWERRGPGCVDDVHFTGFHAADEIAVASLHLMRHLLRGDMKPSHVYEIAWMLDHSSGDGTLWDSWHELHHPSLRRLEAICFALAQLWFDCSMPGAAAEEIEQLPSGVQRWLEIYSGSPLAGRFRPNKDELWLHWSLLDSRRARFAVLRRRLLPENLPGSVDTATIPEQQLTWRIRLRARRQHLVYLGRRSVHHLRALGPTFLGAIRWLAGSARQRV